jgi:hypothetical protein
VQSLPGDTVGFIHSQQPHGVANIGLGTHPIGIEPLSFQALMALQPTRQRILRQSVVKPGRPIGLL